MQNICHTLKYSKSSNTRYGREIVLFCFHVSLSNPSQQSKWSVNLSEQNYTPSPLNVPTYKTEDLCVLGIL